MHGHMNVKNVKNTL